MTRRSAAAAAAVLCAAALLAGPAAARSSTFMTGFADSIWESSANPNAWFNRTVATGAQFVLLPVDWAAISPRRPQAGTDPADPANSAYDWGTLDATIRGAVAHGLTVAFTVAGGGGPAWADGPGRPASVQPGTWRPDANAFGAFARALARRYSGSFNPGTGILPRVRYYQGWSEPNLPDHLNPQWVRSHGHWVAESPIIYRGLLNAFYAAVKSVRRSNVVITGGTAPFGDPPGGGRMPPALFVRELLCLHGSRLAHEPCPRPAHFDILAHHPYEVGGPFQKALLPDDVSLPDMSKLTRPLAVAERISTALPRGHKRVWVTEFSWDSNPPDPHGVPIMQRARWIDEALYELWHEGVGAIAWYLLRDQPPVPSYSATYQSGLYYFDGRVKPGLAAFRFPFVVRPAVGRQSVIWGISPRRGTVQVQMHSSRGWRTLYRFHVGYHGVFSRAAVHLTTHAVLRARIAGETSLPWAVG